MIVASLLTCCGVNAAYSQSCGVVSLTRCCAASVNAESLTEFVCKNCHKPAPSFHATSGWDAFVEAVTAAGCPCPTECATHVFYTLEKTAEVGELV